MKKNKLLIGFFISLILLILVEYFIYMNYGTLSRKITNVSFVVTGDNLDDWENLKAGAEAATLDSDCVVTFINCPLETGVDGEEETIKRQLKEGADYVVVASGFKEELEKYIADNNMSKQVSLLSEEKDSLEIDFANYIIENHENSVLILSKNPSKNFQDILSKSGLHYRIMDFDAYSFEDNNTFKNFDIYGIDNRSEAVYYLDKGIIKALGYRDDYSLGYITIMHLLTGKSVDRIAKGVPLYYIVDKESMYSEKMEKVLFPFAK